MSSSLSCSASRPAVKTSGESPTVGFDFGPYLQDGETVSSVTHVQCTSAEQSDEEGGAVATNDLSIGSPAINTAAAFKTDERTVPVNEGVRVRISGGVDGGDYTLRCRVVLSGGDTRDLWPCVLQVRDG